MGGTIKAPDYSFRIGGRRIFFLEAKKPAVNLRDDVDPGYHLQAFRSVPSVRSIHVLGHRPPGAAPSRAIRKCD